MASETIELQQTMTNGPDDETLFSSIINGRSRQQHATVGSKSTVHAVSVSLTVRLLVASSRTGTAKLLRFTAPRICYQQRSVVCDELILDLLLGRLIHVCSTHSVGLPLTSILLCPSTLTSSRVLVNTGRTLIQAANDK